MNPETIQHYRSSLAANALSIFGHSPKLPVHIEQVCALLKVGIVYSDEVAKFKAYLCVEHERDKIAKILLPPHRAGSPYERFCIAHELAHLFLWRVYRAVPHGSSEYWQFEEICDEFARTLLMPEVEVRRRIAADSCHAAALLKESYRLANLAKAPWTQSAHRISEIEERASFFRIEPQADGRLRIMVSTLPRRKERGRFVSSSTPFHEAMVALLREPPGRLSEDNVLTISPAIMASSNVPSFAGASECAAVKGPYGGVRLAMITD